MNPLMPAVGLSVAAFTMPSLALTANGSAPFAADGDGGKAFHVDLASGSVTDSYDIGGEPHGLGLSDREASLLPAPYHLTTIPESGKMMVSRRSEPKVWIVDRVSLATLSEVPILGEGHQMVGLP